MDDATPLYPSTPPADNVVNRQHRFLSIWEESMNDKDACEKAGISRRTLYRWVQNDTENFNAKWGNVEKYRGLHLEGKMYDVLQWATGEEERYMKVLQYPGLLQFALKAALPEKYGEKMITSQEDARRILGELSKMKDDTKPISSENTKSLDDQLNDIFSG